jgi:hypothetical protein
MTHKRCDRPPGSSVPDPRRPIAPALILSLAIVLVAAKVGAHFAVAIGQPPVLGELAAGVVLGNLTLTGFHGLDYLRSDVSVDTLSRLGVILLLIGQLLTGLYARETQMRIDEGQTLGYSEAPRETELAVIDVSDPQFDQVVSIPEGALTRGGTIQNPTLPVAACVASACTVAETEPTAITPSVVVSVNQTDPTWCDRIASSSASQRLPHCTAAASRLRATSMSMRVR